MDMHVFAFVSTCVIFLLAPVIILVAIWILSPLVIYKKRKLIARAQRVSRAHAAVPKIGITGSYGKSSIKEFLAHILSQEYSVLKTPENINTELGVARVILDKLQDTYEYFVAEMGAYRRGEISTLGSIVQHQIGFLTAI